MKSKPPVFFETLRRLDWPWVAWYLARGHKVFVFDFTYQLKKFDWLRRLIHEERVKRIYVHHASRADGLAIDAAEWLYPQIASHPLIRAAAKLHGEEEAAPVFKHALAQSCFRYFYSRLYLSRAREIEGVGPEILFVPESYPEWDRLLGRWVQGKAAPLSGVQVLKPAMLWKRILGGVIKRAYYLAVYLKLGTGFLAAWSGRFLARNKPAAPEPASFCISIASRFLTDFSAGRRFDFLLGPGGLRKENTVFAVSPEGDGPWVEKQKAQGYRILRQSDQASIRGLFQFPPAGFPYRSFAGALGSALFQLGSPDGMHQALSAGLRTVLQEFGLLERIRPRAYIYANQYWLAPRWRNGLVRRMGGESWWYAYSSGGAYTREEGGAFASDRDFGGRHRFWSYENADHFVAPCRPLIDYYRKHNQTIRFYHDIGNIWSEAVLETSTVNHREEILRKWFKAPLEGKKVIAWFDSSFVEAKNSPSSFTEAIAWYEDLLRLANEDSRYLMVVKPSKEPRYYVADDPGQQWSHPSVGKKLIQVWDALKAHPRVSFLDRTTDPSWVIAVSDLTVTFPYTSVSAEAIGARKRGIWYEPGERWRDTLYARSPDLVAHGYPELQALAERLLWKTTDAEYDRFLETTARDLIESHLDGKAVSRFRALLLSGGPEPVKALPAGAAPVVQEWVTA